VIRYLTHPEVSVAPEVPVECWELDAVGVQRVHASLAQPWLPLVDRIVTSDETKARQTAAILGSHLGIEVEVRGDLGENDRSSTGFLPPHDFERMVERFFAAPHESVHGWERAADAQQRIVEGLADLLENPSAASIVVVGHGAVGTLWYCFLARQPIARVHDQPGQGHFFTVDVDTAEVIHRWQPIDASPGQQPVGDPAR
jgi:broad specificity phosphatase PhoE